MKTVSLKVEIETGNDSFQDYPSTSAASILNIVRGKLIALNATGTEFLNGTLQDGNGNAVGWFEFSIDDDDELEDLDEDGYYKYTGAW